MKLLMRSVQDAINADISVIANAIKYISGKSKEIVKSLDKLKI